MELESRCVSGLMVREVINCICIKELKYLLRGKMLDLRKGRRGVMRQWLSANTCTASWYQVYMTQVYDIIRSMTSIYCYFRKEGCNDVEFGNLPLDSDNAMGTANRTPSKLYFVMAREVCRSRLRIKAAHSDVALCKQGWLLKLHLIYQTHSNRLGDIWLNTLEGSECV